VAEDAWCYIWGSVCEEVARVSRPRASASLRSVDTRGSSISPRGRVGVDSDTPGLRTARPRPDTVAPTGTGPRRLFTQPRSRWASPTFATGCDHQATATTARKLARRGMRRVPARCYRGGNDTAGGEELRGVAAMWVGMAAAAAAVATHTLRRGSVGEGEARCQRTPVLIAPGAVRKCPLQRGQRQRQRGLRPRQLRAAEQRGRREIDAPVDRGGSTLNPGGNNVFAT
jgi:hypothetical protein